jgi:hypothetical protein
VDHRPKQSCRIQLQNTANVTEISFKNNFTCTTVRQRLNWKLPSNMFKAPNETLSLFHDTDTEGLYWVHLSEDRNKHQFRHVSRQNISFPVDTCLRKSTVKLSPCLPNHQAMKTYLRCGSKASRILNLCTTRRCVVSFTPRPLSLRSRSPRHPLDKRLGGPQSRSGRGGEEKKIPSLCLPGTDPRIRRIIIRVRYKPIQIWYSTHL